MDECEFYTMVGIQNLSDRCLVTVDGFNKVVMHHLLQEMGREIVRQESPNEPGERSGLWNHKDSFNVLRHNTGTRKIEGLILDMNLLKYDKSTRTVFGVKRKRNLEELLDNSVLSNVRLLKRYRLGIFWRNSVGIAPENSNQIALETNAFGKMYNLKLLWLYHVQICGSFETFPKKIRWLSWHGFPYESMPSCFPLEALAALEMPYSSLKHFGDGTKFLELLKILNLSHSHNLAKTPDFVLLPNLERLELEDCTSLVKIHESIGHLVRLVLLNLKDCRNLRKIPKSIGVLKSLGTLDISGCSNLETLPTETRNMDSLTVLRAKNVTCIARSPAIIQNVKAWYSFICLSPLKLKRNRETSWASSLPRSLVELSLAHCNLSNDGFPTDLSNLSSLSKLDLSENPITSLPDCIKGLTRLKVLYVNRCKRLRSLVVLQKVKYLSFPGCSSLEKIMLLSLAFKKTQVPRKCGLSTIVFLSTRATPLFLGIGGYGNLEEVSGIYKLEPLGNVDKEITNNLGLFDFGSMQNLKVTLRIPFSDLWKLSRLQGCHEEHVFYTYLPGSKVPGWFNLTSNESSLSFTVPNHNVRIRGLSLCTVYAFSTGHNPFHTFRRLLILHKSHLNTVITNTTKRLIWSHCPYVTGIPEADEEEMMIWLSYWKFENQVEAGDELNISVFTGAEFQVMEVGVHLVYDVENGEKITQQILSTSNDEVSEEIHRYGVAVPGNASSYQETTQVFKFGNYQWL